MHQSLAVVVCSIVITSLLSAADGWAQTVGHGVATAAVSPTSVVPPSTASQAITIVSSLDRVVAREVRKLSVVAPYGDSQPHVFQQPSGHQRSWIGRHPVLLGALIGFGTGFAIGYAAGDDGIFPDTDKEFNAVVLGAAGALVGAIVGNATAN
jgi:hypothetical protein